MVRISEEHVEEFKQLYKKRYGKDLTNQEALESAQNLVNFVEILVDVGIRELQRKKRLKKEPKGFFLEEDGKVYSCILCMDSISGKNGWWDLNGMKCLYCQKAIDTGLIPASVCKDDKSYYKDWEIRDLLGMHSQTLRKMVKEGKIKAREIPRDDNFVPFKIFLKSENKYLNTLITQKHLQGK